VKIPTARLCHRTFATVEEILSITQIAVQAVDGWYAANALAAVCEIVNSHNDGAATTVLAVSGYSGSRLVIIL
jgi:hypothetical protein